jgi:hypothetical protein
VPIEDVAGAVGELIRAGKVKAPWLLEGPIDGESVRTYVER